MKGRLLSGARLRHMFLRHIERDVLEQIALLEVASGGESVPAVTCSQCRGSGAPSLIVVIEE